MNNVFAAYLYQMVDSFIGSLFIINDNPVSINFVTNSVKKYQWDIIILYFPEMVKIICRLGNRYQDSINTVG